VTNRKKPSQKKRSRGIKVLMDALYNEYTVDSHPMIPLGKEFEAGEFELSGPEGHKGPDLVIPFKARFTWGTPYFRKR